MKHLLWLAPCLALNMCVTTRYVSTSCIPKDQVVPAEPPKVHDKLNGAADHDLPVVAGSALRLRSWGEALQGIVESCR